MTSQKLYELLSFLDDLDRNLSIQPTFQAVLSALSNIVSQPAVPAHQSALADALSALDEVVTQMGDSLSPSQYGLIEAMGGARFFDPLMAVIVKDVLQGNAMTPSVANDFVNDLVNRRADFLNTVRQARQSLEKLRIKTTTLQPGSADLSFLIPRDIFDNELGKFTKELIFINRLLLHLNEALTGEVKEVELEQLGSSVPTVALAAAVPVIGTLAWAVNKFLDAWKKIEEIREIRAKLANMGMRGTALNELTEQIDSTVDEVVEETTEKVLLLYEGTTERKHELENAVRQDTRRLFGQIERGLTVEFRAEPKKEGDAAQQKALKEIDAFARVMQFPQVTQQPMLLKGEEVVEGVLHTVKHAKKTITRKTTTSKKSVSSDATGEVTKE